MKIIRDFLQRHWMLLAILGLSIAWKTALSLLHAFSFNADEAVVALMARHILQGERPLFFYGQAYMGSLDAWLAAAGFALWGQQVWVIRAVQSALYAGTIALWYFFALRISNSLRTARLTAFLLAVPPVLVTLYTTVSLGGYGEALFLGSACLLLAAVQSERSAWKLAGQGVATGLGIWVFPLSLVYSVPAACLALLRLAREKIPASHRLSFIVIFFIGLMAGAIPWWTGFFSFGPNLFAEMAGSAISGTLTGDPLHIFWIRLLGLILFGSTVVTGIRPPWEIRWLVPLILPLALVLWLAALLHAIRSIRKHDAVTPYRWLLAACLVLFAAVFLFTPFGNDPSGRYFLPLYPIGAAACAALLDWLWSRTRMAAGLCLGILAAYFAAGTLQCALILPPGITTQFDPVAQLDERSLPAVIDFLRARGEWRGYTNYWVSFPLAFLSDEELIFTARLPYHEDLRYISRDDRYPAYDDAVGVSGRVAYITTRNPLLDRRIVEELDRQNISYQVEQIGDYRIYYQLSQLIRPEDIHLTP